MAKKGKTTKKKATNKKAKKGMPESMIKGSITIGKYTLKKS